MAAFQADLRTQKMLSVEETFESAMPTPLYVTTINGGPQKICLTQEDKREQNGPALEV